MGTLCSHLELNREAGWQVKAKLGTPGGGHDPGREERESVHPLSTEASTQQHQNRGLASSWPFTCHSPFLRKGEVSTCSCNRAALLEREGNLGTLGYFWGNVKDFSKSSLND